jgi:hypothetical protein
MLRLANLLPIPLRQLVGRFLVPRLPPNGDFCFLFLTVQCDFQLETVIHARDDLLFYTENRDKAQFRLRRLFVFPEYLLLIAKAAAATTSGLVTAAADQPPAIGSCARALPAGKAAKRIKPTMQTEIMGFFMCYPFFVWPNDRCTPTGEVERRLKNA